MHIMII